MDSSLSPSIGKTYYVVVEVIRFVRTFVEVTVFYIFFINFLSISPIDIKRVLIFSSEKWPISKTYFSVRVEHDLCSNTRVHQEDERGPSVGFTPGQVNTLRH